MLERLFIVLFAASAMVAQAGAATWFVSPCGQDAWAGVQGPCVAPLGPKRSIQAAIDVAGNGDTVIVLPGVYVENIDLDGKAIHLLSTGGASATTINGGGSGPVVSCNSLEGPGTIIEGFTITNGQAVNGGGMLLALSSPSVIDCVFQLNSAGEEGGGVAGYFASPSFTGCVFDDNAAAMPTFHAYGGGAYFEGGSPEFIGCEFTDNDVVGNGGAVFFGPDCDATLEGCTFIGNTASRHPNAIGWAAGGAVCVDGATLGISDSTFENNDAFGVGGAMAVRYFSDVSVSATTFLTNRSLESRGGAIDVHSSSLSVFAGTFTDNEVSAAMDADQGGGALFADASDVEITWSSFVENEALMPTVGANGGAICAVDTTLSVTATVFLDNETVNHGGAIEASGDNGELTISGCTFTSNRSESYGGAVRTDEIDVEIDQCTFVDNLAWGSGGAVSVRLDFNDSASVADCEFTSNTGFNGGGLRIGGGTSTVEGALFEQNHSQNVGGGAAASQNSFVIFRETSFVGNTASGGGGGLAITEHTYAIGCEFSGNSASYGGGVATLSAGAEGVYIGCLFEGNSAESTGGAIAVTTGSAARAINSLIIANTAPHSGGTIDVSYPTGDLEGAERIDIFNTTIADNIGGGVRIDANPDNVTLANTVLWGNTLGDAFIGDDPVVRHSNVEGGAAGIGNIDADPLFVNPLLGNYRLGAGSPCIDSGLNSAVPLDDADLDADAITAESTPFDFDGEARMMSVAGCSTEVVVDMGAFEAIGLTEIIPGDLDGDGAVTAGDLAILLAAWGPCGSCCPADYTGDGQVDSSDLAVLLASWG